MILVYRGQYSDAVLSELESQNDQQVEGILGKVKILKEVGFAFPFHTELYAISEE